MEENTPLPDFTGKKYLTPQTAPRQDTIPKVIPTSKNNTFIQLQQLKPAEYLRPPLPKFKLKISTQKCQLVQI